MNCEDCKYFDEHPFVREGDFDDYCKKHNSKCRDICSLDKLYCFDENGGD